MNKHVFVMIRYSVLSKTSSWNMNKLVDFEDYKKNLFSPARLEKREYLFKTVTLPSLLDLCEKNTTVFIFISESMPEYYCERLKDLLRSYSNIRLVSLSYESNINKQMNNTIKKELKNINVDTVYSTVRLDDDDALSKNYFNMLFPYLNSNFVGYCISFSSGAAAIVSNGKLDEFYLRFKPKVAIGIAWINFFSAVSNDLECQEVSIYSLGNHMKVDERYPTIIDPRGYAWIRTVHDESDLFDENMADKYRKTQKTDKEYLGSYFSIK